MIGAAAEKLMRDAAPAGADVEIDVGGRAAGALRPDAPAIQLGLDAFEQVLGVRPLLVRSGGTLPIVPALADKGIATILTGFGLPESNVHSPNEKFLVRYFEQGVDTAAALYTKYEALPTTRACEWSCPHSSREWPNSRIASMIGRSAPPFSVSSYSTRGGDSG